MMLIYFFFLKVSDYLLFPFALGMTINRTAFFDVLLFSGLVASRLKSSSLSTKLTSFYKIWID